MISTPPVPKPTPSKEAPKPKEDLKKIVPVAATAVAVSKTPLPTEVTELEKAIEVAATLAVKEYNKAIKVLNE